MSVSTNRLAGTEPRVADTVRVRRSRLKPPLPVAIRVTQRFNAPPERVFSAWLDPALAGRWLFATALRPMTDVDIDARVGGSFCVADRRNGQVIEHRGRYIEIVPNRRLVFDLVGENRPRVATRVFVEIVPRKQGCELTLSHEDVPPDHANRTEARWTGILYGLGEALASARRRADST